MKKFKRLTATFLIGTFLISGVVASVHISNSNHNKETFAAAGSYYNGITASGGKQLLGQLHDLMATTHTTYTTYNDCKDPNMVYATDGNPNDPNSVIEWYSQANIGKPWGGGKQGTWNREHVWCQSHTGGLWGTNGGGSDLQHIRPVECGLNSGRNNSPYGIVADHNSAKNQKYYEDSSNVNVALGGWKANDIFEPLDTVKGDVARILFYLYCHYNKPTNADFGGSATQDNAYFGNLVITNIVNVAGSSYSDPFQLLLAWHNSDPVSAAETRRNEAAFGFQGNRNPFIDNPSYANAIWGNGTVVHEPSVTISPQSASIEVGATKVFNASALNLSSTDVNWSITPTSVAKITKQSVSSATVQGVTEGNATLKATSKADGTVSATASISVTPVGSVDPNPGGGEGGGDSGTIQNETTFTIANNATCGINRDADGASVTQNITSGSNSISVSNQNVKYRSKSTSTSYYGYMMFMETSAFMYNSTAPSNGFVKSVNVTYSGSTGVSGKCLITIGASPMNTAQTGTTWNTPAKNGNYNISNTDENKSYWNVTTSTKNVQLDSIVIVFGTKTTTQPTETLVNKINLSGNTNINVGETSQLSLEVLPSNATNKSVTWASDNASVASVNQSGLVTGKSAGTANITATAKDGSGKVGTIKITVNSSAPSVIPVEKITVTGPATLDVNSSAQLGVEVLPVDASNKTVSWLTSNAKIAKVDSNGLVTTVGAGLVTITAKANDGSNIKGNIKITVVEPAPTEQLVSSIEVTGNTSVTIDGTTQLSATVLPSNATNKNVTWSSSDSNIASVDQSGLVTGVAAGSVTITATAKDSSGTKGTLTVTVSSGTTPVEPSTGGDYIFYDFFDSTKFGGSGNSLVDKAYMDLKCTHYPKSYAGTNYTGATDVLTNAAATFVYKNRYCGIGLSKSKAAGTLDLTFATDIKINKVTVWGVRGDGKAATSIKLDTTALTFDALNSTSQCNFPNGYTDGTEVVTNINPSKNTFSFSSATGSKMGILAMRFDLEPTLKDKVQGFADNYMHMNDYTSEQGWCSDATHNYYQIAKKALNDLETNNPGAKNEFQTNSTFAQAKARYEAWARANNDASPYVGATIVAKQSLFTSNTAFGSDTTMIVVITVVSFALMALYGCYHTYNRKRRER